MKKGFITALLLLLHFAAQSQTQYQYGYVGASFQPLYTNRVLSVKGNSSLKDSLDGIEKPRLGFTVFLQYQKQLGRNLLLQTGLQYTNTGFIRVISNLTFKTVIHPDVQPMDQIIMTAPAPTAELNYVFDYIDIPVLFNRRLYLTSASQKHWEFFGTFGASLNFLIQDRVAVRLKGFTINNDRAFNLQNTYLASKFFNLTGHLGFRANYQYSNKLGFFTQPLLSIPFLPATSGKEAYRLFSAGVQVGVYFNLDVKGEEELVE